MELIFADRRGNGARAVRTRFSLIWLLAACYLAISGLTRAALYLRALRLEQVTAADAVSVFVVGAVYDAIAALFITAPFALYLLLVPRRFFARRWHRSLVWIGIGLAFFGLAYLAAVEYFFFDEFNARFNYVAVEYLIYPHEVFVNIWQSYPVARALITSALAASLLLWSMRGRISAALNSGDTLRDRCRPALVLLVLLVAAYFAVDSTSGRSGRNRVADELAANGVYSFFSAAMTSDLDYRAYYLTVDDQEAAARARRFVSQPNARFIEGAANPLARHIRYAGAPRLLHVVVLLEESLAERPYGKDTMVVIVADHGARVYGREDIPLPSYEIPLMVYAPRHVQPARVDALTSQIDVAPTVLGLLDISYDSVFFGRDVLAARPGEHRALFNHNRDIALYADGKLSELAFRNAYSTLFYDPAARRQRPAPSDPEGTKAAAAVFQLAYDLYRGGRYRVE